MKLRHVLSRVIEHDGERTSVRAALNAVVAANVNEPDGEQSVTGEQGSRRTTAGPPGNEEAPDE